MIIVKGNNIITGLTTAAGVWTTATIGIAVGYGFYAGAGIVSAFFLITIMLFVNFERKRKNSQKIYIEIDNLSNVNDVICSIKDVMGEDIRYEIMAPKSNCTGNIGLDVIYDGRNNFDMNKLLSINNLLFAVEES